MIGQTISHYKILQKLGEGGMGVVYKAQDLKLDRLVALKFLPSHLTANEENKKRFVHEAKAASTLDHPNICTFYELGETDNGQLFIAMAFYEGETVKDKIKDRPLPLNDAIDIAISIAQGLAKAHEKGITHRDIKSDNVMVTADSGVKIMDFGLASIVGASTLTKTGATVGTVPYMSPEQARGEKVDHRSDIWSLGAVIYEMVTGQLPFRSQYNEAIVYSILNENPPPLTSLRSDVPMELERIVRKAMAKEPAERYQHADEMATDLIAQFKESKRDATGGTRFSKPQKKKQVLLYSSIAVLGVLLAVGLFVFIPSATVTPTNGKTIAVLPFTNMSGNPDDEYFSDGITEDILTQLTKIADLTVISRTTMMQYKGTKKSLRDIAKELNAGVVLEGSVRRVGSRVRIVGQLIDAQSDKHLWADTFDREIKDILEIQSDVAEKIAAVLGAKLSSAEKVRLTATTATNPEAYKLLLEGRYLAGRGNVLKAIDLYKKAINIDSNDARVWSSLAFAYRGYAGSGDESFRTGFEKARHAAEKAILLADQLADGHIALGDVKQSYDWHWEAAYAEYQKALVLEPGNVRVIQSMSELSRTLGRFDEAIRLTRRRMELVAELKPGIYHALALQLILADRLEEALLAANKAVELLGPLEGDWIHFTLAQVYLLQGRIDSAIIAGQKVSEGPVRLTFVSIAYHEAGRKAEADGALKELIARYESRWAWQIAWVYAYRGDADNTFKWLEKAYDVRDTGLTEITGHPFFRKIAGDPRYAKFLKKMKLPFVASIKNQ